MYNWRLIITIAVTTAGASFQFYNFGAINTSQRIVESWMNGTYSKRYGYVMSASTLALLWSVTVGSAFIGAIIGSLLTRLLAEKYGRKLSLIINGCITLIGAGLEASCKAAGSPEMFIFGRLFLGFSNGVATGMVPLFLTEIAPIEKRGAAGTAHQIVVAFADWFSLLTTLPQVLGSEALWPIAFAAFPAVPAFVMVLVLPFTAESPRYLLMTKGDRGRAEKAVKFYTTSEEQYKSTLDGLVQEASVSSGRSSERQEDWRGFFRRRELRMPLLISVLVMTAQQFTACSAVFQYSTNIFIQAGLSHDVAELSTLAIGICYFFFTLPSPYFIEKVGRRRLYLFQLCSCLIFLIILTVFVALRNTYGFLWASYGSIGALVAYMCVYGVGSSVPWVITTELYEQEYRSFGVAVGTFFAWFWGLVTAMGYYPFQQAVGIEYSFIPFIVILALCIAGLVILLPETKNKTTTEIVNEIQTRKGLRRLTLGSKLGKQEDLEPLLEATGEAEVRDRGYQSISRFG